MQESFTKAWKSLFHLRMGLRSALHTHSANWNSIWKAGIKVQQGTNIEYPMKAAGGRARLLPAAHGIAILEKIAQK
jgi:hypothetical protein